MSKQIRATVVADDGFTPGDGSVTDNSVSANAGIARSKLAQDTESEYSVPVTAMRIFDDMTSLLSSSVATSDDDFALVGGTVGTGSPSLQTADQKGAGSTTYKARFLFALPVEYDSAETIKVRLHAGMLTTVADTTGDVDVEAYKSDDEAGVGSDLVSTAAQSANSLTLADKDFTLTTTGLSAGDVLDIQISFTVNDSATGTEVKGIIGNVSVLLDIRG